MSDLRVERVTGAALGTCLPELARLRIRVFREYPQLCEGRAELRTTFSWRDLDEAAESPKPLAFWLKRLNGG
ncbi:MAG: hypothetical protein LJE61_02485 [Thiocapsa sp.]|jgi:hypothetical protein|nr:hypothetical protein [Thiocapsa sp.]MCG6896745.1 hypothetical protein [Thiocapsa sp.]MCG6984055.1 hypothetical protein [Thiocapsa sp.]